MPRDVIPPVKLVEGPHKRILTKKAREAAEVSVRHVKPWPAFVKTSSATVSVPVRPASVKTSSLTVSVPVRPVSVAQVTMSCPSDYTGDECISNMSMTVASTSSSVLCFNVKEGTVVICIGSWILETPGQPAGCSVMQKCAGVRRLSMLRIKLRILQPHVPFLLTLA